MSAWSRFLGAVGLGAVTSAAAATSAPVDIFRQFAPTNSDPVDHRSYARWYDNKLPAGADLPYALDAVMSDTTVLGASQLAFAQANTAKWRAIPGGERVQRWLDNKPREVAQAVHEGSMPGWVNRTSSRGARRNADHANANFGWAGAERQADESWEEMQTRMLYYQEYGHRVLIPQFKRVGSRVYIRRFDDIEPHAYGHNDFHWERGDFRGLTVYDRDEMIPADRLMILTFRKRGRDLTGHGYLETAYPWWELKRHLRALIAVAADKWAIPTPVINIDRKVARSLGYDDNAVTDMVASAIQAVKAYASGEGGYLLQNPGVNVSSYGVGHFRLEAIQAGIDLCNREMWASRNQQFLGHKSTTTAPLESTTPEQSDFRLALANVLDVIAETVGGARGPARGPFHSALEYSYGAQRRRDLPLFVHSGIHTPLLAKVLSVMAHLRQAGMVTPHDRLEELFYEMIGEVMPADSRRPVEERLATKNNEVEGIGHDADPSRGGLPAKPGRGAK